MPQWGQYAVFVFVVAPFLLACLLGFGLLVGLLAKIACPTCGRTMSWLASSWNRGGDGKTRRAALCLCCRRFIRQVRTAEGWVEAAPVP